MVKPSFISLLILVTAEEGGCKAPGDVHILCGCKWVLESETALRGENRYTWRHNNVCEELFLSLAEFLI